MNINEEIKKTIFRYLERMEYSEKQIEDKLLMLKKNFPKVRKYTEYSATEVKKAIQDLKDIGVIDDKRSVINQIDRSLSSTVGKYRLKLKLLKKKYPKKLIDEELSKITSDTDRDLAAVIRLANRKYKQISSRHPERKIFEIKKQLTAYLATRGFDFTEIKKIIEQSMENDEIK